MLPHDERRIYARNLEIPAGGGIGNARAMARAYGVFATGDASSGCAEPGWTGDSRDPCFFGRCGATAS